MKTQHHMRWWDQHQWKEKREAEEEGREKLRCNISPTTGLAKPTRSYRVGMIFRIVLSWGKKLLLFNR